MEHAINYITKKKKHTHTHTERERAIFATQVFKTIILGGAMFISKLLQWSIKDPYAWAKK